MMEQNHTGVQKEEKNTNRQPLVNIVFLSQLKHYATDV